MDYVCTNQFKNITHSGKGSTITAAEDEGRHGQHKMGPNHAQVPPQLAISPGVLWKGGETARTPTSRATHKPHHNQPPQQRGTANKISGAGKKPRQRPSDRIRTETHLFPRFLLYPPPPSLAFIHNRTEKTQVTNPPRSSHFRLGVCVQIPLPSPPQKGARWLDCSFATKASVSHPSKGK